MSKVKIEGNASGTGTLTIAAPNTNTNRTLTLPDEDITLGGGVDGVDSDYTSGTALKIDSSGQVMIGRTSAGGTGMGHTIRGDNSAIFSRVGASTASESLRVNKDSYEGTVADFTRNGTIRGEIGFEGNDSFYIAGRATANSAGLFMHETGYITGMRNAVRTDNYVDLGSGNYRFKDLHLGGDAYFNSGYGTDAKVYGCRAWVNFQGTGTVTIRAGGGFSSITRSSTGYYRGNFSTAMPDANYSCNGNVGGNGGGAGDDSLVAFGTDAAGNQSASYTPTMRCRNFSNGTAYDVVCGFLTVYR